MELISILNFRFYIELLRKILFWQKTDMTNNHDKQYGVPVILVFSVGGAPQKKTLPMSGERFFN
ncbi:hypothetical protein H6G25_17595 [Dolichospermum sp. FACHB-1091]|uniref:hypothetical protein n=1 Tax=Dolichospermum sp. FACHB-1091 TaxID=2692798 RepID=UPI00168126A4|nr:hypothetical protein [Dolichospermum sp. FACHB-1091]MBD2444966.1 hypothetical protein [Dolichospermum sp. FACHB-1091]